MRLNDKFKFALNLITGRSSKVMIKESVRETALNINDSIRNWPISCFLCEPIAFLMPISFNLVEDLAVKRLINWMLASSIIITPIIPKRYT